MYRSESPDIQALKVIIFKVFKGLVSVRLLKVLKVLKGLKVLKLLKELKLRQCVRQECRPARSGQRWAASAELERPGSGKHQR